MKAMRIWIFLLVYGFSSFSPLLAVGALEKSTLKLKKEAEQKIKEVLAPVLSDQCAHHTLCRLLQVKVETSSDLSLESDADPDLQGYLPGLSNEEDDFLAEGSASQTEVTTAEVSLLFNSKLQSETDQAAIIAYLKTLLQPLGFPVEIKGERADFPSSPSDQGLFVSLRNKVLEEFRSQIDTSLKRFCPHLCRLTEAQVDVKRGMPADILSAGPNTYRQEGGVILLIQGARAVLHLDQSLFEKSDPKNRTSGFKKDPILRDLQLETSSFPAVQFDVKEFDFPKEEGGGRSPASLSEGVPDKKIATSLEDRQTTTETTTKIEKIERVESGDAIQKELEVFKTVGLIFFCSIFALLIFIAIASIRALMPPASVIKRASEKAEERTQDPGESFSQGEEKARFPSLSKRYEIDQLHEELTAIYAQYPRVSKQVFSRVLNEEGIEVLAECIHVFGESIIFDLLRDPSLLGDSNELIEFYLKNEILLTDDEKLELLRKLKSRTVAAKMTIFGSRASHTFDFLSEMDAVQILDLLQGEPTTVKAIVLTQCDHQKRALIYSHMESDLRMQVLEELPRIDYLPRDYVANVSTALRRKRRENPKLNTEALPGSDVLVNLLEKTGQEMQKAVVRNLEVQNPETARTIKSKLMSIDTLLYLRDGQLLEVILSLKHDELLSFLKGCTEEIRQTLFSKSPEDLVTELQEELAQMQERTVSRETYQTVERKILNRLKVMVHEGQINLLETNERMFQYEASSQMEGESSV